MLIALLFGLIAGFVLAMPPGPVGTQAIKYGLSGHIDPGRQMAFGTALLDGVYCLFAALFVTIPAVKEIFMVFQDTHPNAMIIGQIVVFLVFLAWGIHNVRAKEKSEFEENKKKNSKFNSYLENLKQKGPFFVGVAIALTNIPNPTFFPSIIALNLFAIDFELWSVNITNSIIFALGFSIGNFIWLFVLSKIMVILKPRMSDKIIIRIRQFAGVTFIGFGTFIGARLTWTHWPEILRSIAFAF